MKNALEVSKNLGLLRKYTADITELMENGGFYRLSFAERFKLIRRIKKLYNRLLGPISPVKLRHIVAAAGVVALNTACFAPIGSTVPDYRTGGTDDPGSSASGSAAFNLTPYFQYRGYNRYGLLPGVYEETLVETETETTETYFFSVGRSSAFVDLDGDGDLDVVHSAVDASASFTYYDYYYYYGDPIPDQYAPFAQYSESGYSFLGGGPSLWYQLNEGTAEAPEFGARNPLPVASVDYVGGITLADSDGDGDYDLWMQSREFPIPFTDYFYGETIYTDVAGIVFFENTGSSTSPYFVRRGSYGEISFGNEEFDVALGDVDADGDLDLFASNYLGLNLYENRGTPTEPVFDFDEPVLNPFGLDAFAPEYLYDGLQFVVEDIDLDGDVDIISLGTWYDESAGVYVYNEVAVVLNSGDAANPGFSVLLEPDGASAEGSLNYPRVVDLDADGDLDLLTTGASTYYSYSYFFENLILGDSGS